MRKFPVLLLLILCLVLFACTESKNVDGAQSASTSPKESNAMTEPAQSTTSEAAVDVTARVVVNGTINTFTGYATDSTYYFQKTDIQAALGDADFTNAQIVQKNSIDYYSLRDLCTNMNYLFTHDEVLGAEYIWTYPDAMQQISSNDEINRAISRGIGEVRADDSVVTYSEFFTMLDRVVELADPDKLADWQAQFPEARASSDRMTRYDGMKAVLKCAVTLGGNYLSFSIDWLPLNDKIGEKVWDEIGRITDPDRYIPNDFPYQGGGFENEDFSEWDDCGVAYRYSFGKVSLASNHSLFDYDEAENSMLPDRAFTYNAAILASIRLLESESAESDIVALTDPNAVTCDSAIITDTLLDRANGRPAMTQEKQSELRGLVFGWDYNFVGMPVTDAELRNAANWGFNSARVMLTYQTLFDQDANTVNTAQLRQLDRLVAAAMKYNLHLNIVTFSMPGRWARFDSTTFTSTGDLTCLPMRKSKSRLLPFGLCYPSDTRMSPVPRCRLARCGKLSTQT